MFIAITRKPVSRIRKLVPVGLASAALLGGICTAIIGEKQEKLKEKQTKLKWEQEEAKRSEEEEKKRNIIKRIREGQYGAIDTFLIDFASSIAENPTKEKISTLEKFPPKYKKVVQWWLQEIYRRKMFNGSKGEAVNKTKQKFRDYPFLLDFALRGISENNTWINAPGRINNPTGLFPHNDPFGED